MNTFLPDNYEIPQAPSAYMKFSEGLNQIRVLSSAIVGFEYFTTENKPERSKELPTGTPVDIKKDGKVKPFWAFVVYNYQLKKIQILEITQKTIMFSIQSLVQNPKWGDPKMYDIAITKTGEGMETEYNVQGEPPIAPMDPAIVEQYTALNINLEALFTNEDPFKTPKSTPPSSTPHNPPPTTPKPQGEPPVNAGATLQADIPHEITLQELIAHSTDQCTHVGKPFVKACVHTINDMELHNITVQCPDCTLMSKLVHGINSKEKSYVAICCGNAHWYQYDSNEFKSAFKDMPKLFNAVQDYNNPLMNM